MTRPIFLDDLVQEIHQVMRERGMDSWAEATLISIVEEASRRIYEREGRRDQDRHVRPGPRLGSGHH